MAFIDHVDTYRHITPEQLHECMPLCNQPVIWARAFDTAIEKFNIVDRAMLMAQVGHESADLTRLEENLNYSALRLQQVWPSRFPNIAATDGYAQNPEALANNVYGNRMGNRYTGDGWLFRGRGPIQLTGRYNYTRFARAISDNTPVDKPQLLVEPMLGALAACWFYANHVPTGASVLAATKRINGGRHGLSDRQARYDLCKKMFN